MSDNAPPASSAAAAAAAATGKKHEPTPFPWGDDLDAATKGQLVEWLQANTTIAFLREHKVYGQAKAIAKSNTKDRLVEVITAMLTDEIFAGDEEREVEEAALALEDAKLAEEKAKADEAAAAEAKAEAVAEAEANKPLGGWTKEVISKGDKVNYPVKGDRVKVIYKGELDDGTQFDTTWVKNNKRHYPLQFKVGVGSVIRGWDEAIVTMSVGEKAKLTIEPSAAYGKKGVPDAKVPIPPNATLHFEMTLMERM